MSLTLEQKIEAILFYKGEPVKIKELSNLLNESPLNIESAIKELSVILNNRGLALVHNGNEVMLGTCKEASSLIEAIKKEEISRDLGKASLETLSIVLYKGPISRRGIDFIRGVNSQFILRNLLVRGLIERVEEKGQERGYVYRSTTELLSYIGIKKIEDLPEYAKVGVEITHFIKTEQNDDVEAAEKDDGTL